MRQCVTACAINEGDIVFSTIALQYLLLIISTIVFNTMVETVNYPQAQKLLLQTNKNMHLPFLSICNTELVQVLKIFPVDPTWPRLLLLNTWFLTNTHTHGIQRVDWSTIAEAKYYMSIS